MVFRSASRGNAMRDRDPSGTWPSLPRRAASPGSVRSLTTIGCAVASTCVTMLTPLGSWLVTTHFAPSLCTPACEHTSGSVPARSLGVR